MSYKIAYAAGHCLTTAGKRLPKALDKNQTREWVLNDRVARYFAVAASAYEGVELLRLDDPSGKAGNPVATRAKKANDWGADVLIEFHHNAGILLGKGGGIVAFSHKEQTPGAKLRDAIYAACLALGGLKGNRVTPKQAKAFTILKNFKGAGVLLECGFMDSKTDAPVILQPTYSKNMGYATMAAIAKTAGLKRKSAQTPEKPPEEQPAPQKKSVDEIAREVIRGLWGNGSTRKKKLTAAGYDYSTVQKRVNALLKGGKA